jgi:uncharacterized protein (TIGR02001 family)
MCTRAWLACLGVSLLPAAAWAENVVPGKFSANIGFVSDYVFRGISQTQEKPALQGGVDYEHPSGFYLGAWGSNINFEDGDRANFEANIYGGYAYSLGPWSLDGWLIYYAYPGAKSEFDYDYYEIAGSAAYDLGVATLTASVFHTPENYNESGPGTYYSLAAGVPLPHGFSLDGKVGCQRIDDAERFGVPDYTDWSGGITFEWQSVTFGLHYTDTNLSREECPDDCDARGIASVTFTY